MAGDDLNQRSLVHTKPLRDAGNVRSYIGFVVYPRPPLHSQAACFRPEAFSHPHAMALRKPAIAGIKQPYCSKYFPSEAFSVLTIASKCASHLAKASAISG
jgi:hypothetical protein